MDWVKILNEIFSVCIVPLLGLLTAYIVTYIRTKKLQIQKENDNKLFIKYTNMLEKTICDCVIATNQTYVDALKQQNVFDKEAQEKAFQMTFENVMGILNADAKEYLTNIFGDLNQYIIEKIESEVAQNK